MKLYKLTVMYGDEIDDMAICYALSKEDAIKKFENLYTIENCQIEEVYFNKYEVAILTDY